MHYIRIDLFLLIYLDRFSNIPKENINNNNDVPPCDTRGRGIPVKGNTPIFAPMLRYACTPKREAMPTAKSLL